MTFNERYRQSGCAFHPSRLGLIAFAPNDASVLNWTPARLIEQMDRVGTRTAMPSIWNPGATPAFAMETREKILGEAPL